ncbi:hypothetical protein FOXB_04152, partial [Fusarium oxysporum f. sp. conglutinans Fo5176]
LNAVCARVSRRGFLQPLFEHWRNWRAVLGFDAANLRLADVAVDTGAGPTADGTLRNNDVQQRPNLKRKNTAPPGPIINRRRPDVEVIWSLAPSVLGLSTLGPVQHSFSYTSGEMPHSSPGLLATPTSVPIHHESQEMCTMHDHMVGDASANNAAVAAAAAAGFTMSSTSQAFASHHMHSMGGAPFSPLYSYGSGSSITNAGPGMINEANGGYDAVFGTVPTNALGSPAARHGGDRHNKMQFNQVRPGLSIGVSLASDFEVDNIVSSGKIRQLYRDRALHQIPIMRPGDIAPDVGAASVGKSEMTLTTLKVSTTKLWKNQNKTAIMS